MMPPPPPSPGSGASLAVISGATAAPSITRKVETKARDEPPAKTIENPPAVEPALPSGYTRSKRPPAKAARKPRRKCPLPSFKDHAWEGKADGAFESWHVPQQTSERTEKVYLGRVGKKLLAEWLALPVQQRRKVAEAWISAKRKGKGIG